MAASVSHYRLRSLITERPPTQVDSRSGEQTISTKGMQNSTANHRQPPHKKQRIVHHQPRRLEADPPLQSSTASGNSASPSAAFCSLPDAVSQKNRNARSSIDLRTSDS
ncbi:hypothetical protein HAX54_032693 [Datura stramonium]|uniref:Uncharacterized protein n=1 Tax=Datura stramonium TaxID=4076 RepID=A0ABS8VEV8_DATST|nr:hypothetical protein [Datura stramonium]